MKKEDIKQVFARNLNELLRRRGLNGQRLHEMTGLSLATISEARNAISAPGIDTLALMAEKLGVPAFELLVDNEEIRARVYQRALRDDPLPEEPVVRPAKEAAHRSKKGGSRESPPH